MKIKNIFKSGILKVVLIIIFIIFVLGVFTGGVLTAIELARREISPIEIDKKTWKEKTDRFDLTIYKEGYAVHNDACYEIKIDKLKDNRLAVSCIHYNKLAKFTKTVFIVGTNDTIKIKDRYNFDVISENKSLIDLIRTEKKISNLGINNARLR